MLRKLPRARPTRAFFLLLIIFLIYRNFFSLRSALEASPDHSPLSANPTNGHRIGTVRIPQRNPHKSASKPKPPPQTPFTLSPSDNDDSGPLEDVPPYNLTTNPLSMTSPIIYGPWKLSLPGPYVSNGPLIFEAGHPFTLAISCNAKDDKDCPPVYTLLFYGPSVISPPSTAFSHPTDPDNINPRYVMFKTTIHTPGVYHLYGYPASVTCSRPENSGLKEEAHIYRRLIHGTPVRVEVRGEGARREVPRSQAPVCRDLIRSLDGRWVRSISPDEPLEEHDVDPKSYTYQPWTCLLPSSSASHFLESQAAKDVKTLLFIGDSTMRGTLCDHTFPWLFNSSKYGPCASAKAGDHSHKSIFYKTPSGRKIAVRFLFIGSDGIDAVSSSLADIAADGPAAIIYNVGLWFSSTPEMQVRDEHRMFFKLLDELWPNESAKVVVRSTMSIVSPLICFDQAGHGRERSREMRGWLLDEFEKWKRRRGGKKVAFVDAFRLSDGRLETTRDGWHWNWPEDWKDMEEGEEKGEMADVIRRRPVVGEVEETVGRWVWGEFERME